MFDISSLLEGCPHTSKKKKKMRIADVREQQASLSGFGEGLAHWRVILPHVSREPGTY